MRGQCRAKGHLPACSSQTLSRLSSPIARSIDMIILLKVTDLKNNQPATSQRGVLESPGGLHSGDLSQAGLPPPFANPLVCNLDFWQGKLDLWSAVLAVGYSPALGPSSGSPAVGSCSPLRATRLPPAGNPP